MHHLVEQVIKGHQLKYQIKNLNLKKITGAMNFTLNLLPLNYWVVKTILPLVEDMEKEYERIVMDAANVIRDVNRDQENNGEAFRLGR